LCQETVKPRERSPSCFRVSGCRSLVTGLQKWLGVMDSNHCMAESKSAALPNLANPQ
jgi:hypothetical protein